MRDLTEGEALLLAEHLRGEGWITHARLNPGGKWTVTVTGTTGRIP